MVHIRHIIRLLKHLILLASILIRVLRFIHFKKIKKLSFIQYYLFQSFKALTTVVAELARILSDSVILPFNCSNYAVDMRSMLAELKAKYEISLLQKNISLKGLEEAINFFSTAAKKFHSRLAKVDKTK